MKNETEKAIKVLIEKSTGNDVKPDEALKFSQAALNLAHALSTFNHSEKK